MLLVDLHTWHLQSKKYCECVMRNRLNKWILVKFRSVTFCPICFGNEGDVASDP